MKIQNVWAVYFSGTDTTKKVVTAIATHLSESLGTPLQEYCFNNPEIRKADKLFTPDDLVVFGTPVYAGRVPNLLLPYIQEKVKGTNTLAVPISLFGNRNVDDGLMELRNTLQSNGFCCIGGGAFVGEHAFSKILGKGRPNADDMALATKLATEIATKVSTLDAPPSEPTPVVGQDPIRPYYTPRDRAKNPINILKVTPKTLDTCTKCGLCATLCPMGSISHEDPTVMVGKCIKCCACEKKCPVIAKYYDDEGYLYHKHELEEEYARPATTEIFY